MCSVSVVRRPGVSLFCINAGLTKLNSCIAETWRTRVVNIPTIFTIPLCRGAAGAGAVWDGAETDAMSTAGRSNAVTRWRELGLWSERLFYYWEPRGKGWAPINTHVIPERHFAMHAHTGRCRSGLCQENEWEWMGPHVDRTEEHFRDATYDTSA